MIQQSVSETDDANSDGEKRLHAGERSGEVETRIEVETWGLLVEISRLEHVGDEWQFKVDLPGGGRGETCGAREWDHVNIGVAFKQLNGCAIRRRGFSALRHADGNVKDMTSSSTHWDEPQLQFEEFGVREALGNPRHYPGGGGDNAPMDSARANSGIGTALGPVI